jgi:hypothetical protein
MCSRPHHDRVTQTPLVHTSGQTYLEMHAPRLILTIEVQVELIENVQIGRYHTIPSGHERGGPDAGDAFCVRDHLAI